MILDRRRPLQCLQREGDVLGERTHHGAAQGRDVAEAAEHAAEIARERPHIGAFAAFGRQHGMVRIGRLDQLETVDDHRPGVELDDLAVAGEVVGAFAFDLHRGIARRHLGDLAGEMGQQRAQGFGARTSFAGADDPSFGIVGIALLAPAHSEAVGLAPVHDERDGLGRLPQRDRQQAGGERVESSGMPGAARLEHAFHHTHGMSRRHAHGLVEHEPAMHVALLALALPALAAGVDRFHVSSSVSGSVDLASRSRRTAGVRRSFSIRSASSNRSSARNRSSGANFRLTRCAISPRR